MAILLYPRNSRGSKCERSGVLPMVPMFPLGGKGKSGREKKEGDGRGGKEATSQKPEQRKSKVAQVAARSHPRCDMSELQQQEWSTAELQVLEFRPLI